MAKYEDLTGRKFGNITVLSKADDLRSSKHAKWNCICDCGTLCIRGSRTLQNPSSSSCGCAINKVAWEIRRERYGSTGNNPLKNKKIRPPRAIGDLKGKKFGRLTVIERVENDKTQSKWKCVCECGIVRFVLGTCLRTGHTKSCGCLAAERSAESKLIHGQASRKNETAEYRIWIGMTKRCRNERNAAWKNYGGRGIKVCERWLIFENFFEDMGRRPSDGHSLDRINVDGNYEPSNCRWATSTEQARNTRLNIRNKTGIRGVSWNKKKNKYAVNISVNKKMVYLGSTSSLDEAIKLRIDGEVKYWKESS